MGDKKPIQISGKNLAALNMADACPRCFWIKNTVKNLPFQTFPGIFASIDAHVKNVVHSVFDETGKAPVWLPDLADAVRYQKVPSWQKSKRVDAETGIVVTGVPDDVFECVDGSLIIPDYKTARYTDGQDKLLPIYIGQLNAYRWLWAGMGASVRSLPLIYCEPHTDVVMAGDDGFSLGFTTKTILVEADDDLIPRLLARAYEILSAGIPEGIADCGDCEKLDALMAAIGK